MWFWLKCHQTVHKKWWCAQIIVVHNHIVHSLTSSPGLLRGEGKNRRPGDEATPETLLPSSSRLQNTDKTGEHGRGVGCWRGYKVCDQGEREREDQWESVIRRARFRDGEGGREWGVKERVSKGGNWLVKDTVRLAVGVVAPVEVDTGEEDRKVRYGKR